MPRNYMQIYTCPLRPLTGCRQASRQKQLSGLEDLLTVIVNIRLAAWWSLRGWWISPRFFMGLSIHGNLHPPINDGYLKKMKSVN